MSDAIRTNRHEHLYHHHADSSHLHHRHHLEEDKTLAHQSLHKAAHPDHQAVKGATHEADKNTRIENHGLPALKITDTERDKKIVVDRSASKADRIHAGYELLANHITNVSFTDEQGKHRNISLRRSAVDGRLKVFEEDRLILADHPQQRQQHEFHQQEQQQQHQEQQHQEQHRREHHTRVPQGISGFSHTSEHSNAVGTYHQPAGGRQLHSPHVDPRYYNLTQYPDGSRSLDFNKCQVDTDGSGYHPEDKNWRPHTSLKLSNGESLNTDKDNFVVLSPSLAKACGVELGDCGYLVDRSTGRAVPVVFGDSGPEGKQSAEASVHAIKQLGRNEKVDGNNGLEGHFQVVVVPHSGDGTGDIARTPDRINLVLASQTTTSNDIVAR